MLTKKAILQNSGPGFIPHEISIGKTRESFLRDFVGFHVKYPMDSACK